MTNGTMPGSQGRESSDGDRRTCVNALPRGARLFEFEIERVIGEGGFGIVYLAFDHSLHRHVALKEFLPNAYAYREDSQTIRPRSEQYRATFEAGLKSFVQEARLLAQFEHPALVRVHRFWEANGTAYMAMGYYDGVTLRELLKATPSFVNEASLKTLVVPLLDAVELLHRRECFHRDIAPDNIIVQPSGAPVLLDFGAARRVIGDMTHALTAVLKPGFAPVEQYAEEASLAQGPWTDIYAFSATLYAAITGKPPPASVGRAFNDTLVPLHRQPPVGYDLAFLRGIDTGLAVQPRDRPQSIVAYREALGLVHPLDERTVVLPKVEMPAIVVEEALAAPSDDERTRPVSRSANASAAALARTETDSVRSPQQALPKHFGALAAVSVFAIGAVAVYLYVAGNRPTDSPRKIEADVASRTAQSDAPAATQAPTMPPAAASKEALVTAAPPSMPAPTPLERSASPPALPASAKSSASESNSPPALARPPTAAPAMPPPSAKPPTSTPAAASPSPTPPDAKGNEVRSAKAPPAATSAPAAATTGGKGDLSSAKSASKPSEGSGSQSAKVSELASTDRQLSRASATPGAVPLPGQNKAPVTAAESERSAAKDADKHVALAKPPEPAAPSAKSAHSTNEPTANITDAKAQYERGKDFQEGRGVAKDPAEAAKWLKRAADQGHAPAQNTLGYAYETGRGVAKDDAAATRLYTLAAAQGDAAAENNLGRTYEQGRGVPRDYVIAAQWYRKAADHGSAWGASNLGDLYANGRGVFRDDAEAAKWYLKGAQQGNTLAQYRLGRLYEDGRGVGKDTTEAAKWFRKAAAQGHADARVRLAALEHSPAK